MFIIRVDHSIRPVGGERAETPKGKGLVGRVGGGGSGKRVAALWGNKVAPSGRAELQIKKTNPPLVSQLQAMGPSSAGKPLPNPSVGQWAGWP